MKKYCISDIHGCRNTFAELLNKISFSQEDELYLLGDYVDRGPDSKGVIDDIMKLQEEGYSVKCLMGNHEEKMLASSQSAVDTEEWLYWGGRETLISFAAKAANEIDAKYTDWLKNLDYYFEVDDFILVHAGLNFLIDDPMEDTHGMMWARHYYQEINYQWLGERIIIHGHTPVDKDIILNQLQHLDKNRYLDIDNGCVYPKDGQAALCCFELGEHKLTWQKYCD